MRRVLLVKDVYYPKICIRILTCIDIKKRTQIYVNLIIVIAFEGLVEKRGEGCEGRYSKIISYMV